jgi:hypothetical protein
LIIDDIEGGGECDLGDGDECLCFHVRSTHILDGFKCQTNVSKVYIFILKQNCGVIYYPFLIFGKFKNEVFIIILCGYFNFKWADNS